MADGVMWGDGKVAIRYYYPSGHPRGNIRGSLADVVFRMRSEDPTLNNVTLYIEFIDDPPEGVGDRRNLCFKPGIETPTPYTKGQRP